MISMIPLALGGALAAALVIPLTACDEHPAEAAGAAEFAWVVPAGGSTNVDPNAPIVVEFTHAMMAGMEQYIAPHEGDVTGPVVPGSWTWNPARTRAIFTPSSPLRSGTRYAIHLGGGMKDASGNTMGFQQHGQHMGGQWATGSMMTGGGMMGGNTSMMGAGWQHANGTYGMVFSFTTS
ncbi:MAG: Ig-like domain-containing protein [Gemmatimonadetes bacterium]|nr:Ig-like domain-containing protein [Gemmatimonadota bacterium]